MLNVKRVAFVKQMFDVYKATGLHYSPYDDAIAHACLSHCILRWQLIIDFFETHLKSIICLPKMLDSDLTLLLRYKYS